MNIKSTVRFHLLLDVEVVSTGKHTLTFDQVNAEAIQAARVKLKELMAAHSTLNLVDVKPSVIHITTLEQP